MSVIENPKIYHITHVDRLPLIIADGCLWCDAEVVRRDPLGTPIGMSSIKQRRLYKLTLASHPGLRVGECVPFYFCPRSVMLYLLYRGNHPDLSYSDGQDPIIHLEADLRQTVNWADQNHQRWAFTLSNAGSLYFEDRCDLRYLDQIDWNSVLATKWGGPDVPPTVKEGKQAEFLVEDSFPWKLVSRIGVRSRSIYDRVRKTLQDAIHRPPVQILPNWYY